MTNFRNAMMAAAYTASASGVTIENSALFSTSTQSLSNTPSSAGDLRNWTVSFWVYLNSQTAYQMIFSTEASGGNGAFQFSTINNFTFLSHNSTGANHIFSVPTRAFRDIGWYNFVIRCSSTSGDGTVKYDNMNISIWANGEAQPVTSVLYNTPSGGPRMFSGGVQRIGAHASTTPNYYVAEIVYLDGQKQNADAFGQYDSTGTFWTPKSPDVIKELTFGTNGFYFDNATNPQTDASGEGNNYTNNNSVVNSTHTPTNIFNLWNPLFGNSATAITLTNGNQTAAQASASDPPRNIFSTIPLIAEDSSGFYAEITCTNVTDLNCLGIVTAKDPAFNFGSNEYYLYDSTGGKRSTGNTQASYGNSYTDGDVIGICVKNGKIYFSKNGTFQNSGDPSTGTESGFAFENISGPFVIMFSGGGSGTPYTITLNSGQSSYSATPPTGTRKIDTTAIASATTRTKSNLEEYFDTTLYEGNGAGQRVGKFLPFTNAFTVGNSALFNTSNYLSRTPSSTGNAKTATFSRWIKRNTTGYLNILFSAVVSGSNKFFIVLNTDNQLELYNYSGAYDFQIETTRTFLDLSQWVHFYVAIDTSESTSADRIKVYINGVQETSFATASYPSLNFNMDFNTASVPNYLGFGDAAGGDVYSAETAWVDGTIYAPSYFGQVDTSTNRWVPKALAGITFGTNGFYQDYADSDNLGDDESGNGNDFTNNNTVVQSSDTPTVNFATLDPNKMGSGLVPSNGNRTLNAKASSAWAVIYGTIPMRSGKWYWECHVLSAGADGVMYGVTNPNTAITHNTSAGDNYYNYSAYGTLYGPTAFKIGSWTTTTFTTGDKIGIAVDMDNGYIYFAKNNTWLMSSDPTTATGTGAAYSIGHEPILFPIVNQYLGYGTNVQFDSSLWSYSAPTGYLALSQDNMPEGESYQTAFSWIKNRDATDNHMLFDRVRGIYNDMHSNASSNQVTNVNTLQRFLNGGVQVGSDVEVNTANESYVAWNWYMETAGSGTSNTDGTINTTATLVDTNIGLSISQFTGTGSNATIGHGLGVVPQMYWVKGIDGGDHWYVYHANNTAAPQTDALLLNGNGATFDDVTLWNDTAPTSSLISLGSSTGVNQSSKKYLAMAFGPSQFTSIGSYVGNGNANGSFVPTINSLGIPLKVQWVMIKRTDAANSWQLTDTVRTPNNASSLILQAQLSNAELDNSDMDNVTGGFKLRSTDNIFNSSGGTYVYLAFGTPMIDVDGRIITGR